VEEKGEKRRGFEAGGEAARLKPLSIPPSPRREAAAGRGAGGKGNPIASPKGLQMARENQFAHGVSYATGGCSAGFILHWTG